MPGYDQWGTDPRPPRRDNLDFVIFVGIFVVVLVFFGGPFLGAR